MSTADVWMTLGARLWPVTYGEGIRTHTAIARLFEGAVQRPRLAAFTNVGAIFAASWADVAYPKIVTTHKYAAALMCTKTDRSIAADLKIPWKAFAISVPNGLLAIAGEREYDTIAVLISPDDECDGPVDLSPAENSTTKSGKIKLAILISGQAGKICLSIGSSNVAMGLFDEPEEFIHAADHDRPIEAEAKRRIIMLARRLVAGTLVGLQTENFVDRSVASKTKEKGRRRGEPAHRTIFVRPQSLNVDCRPAVRDYLTALEGAPPIYQTLVRGHYKRQAYGSAGAMRKIIWIEPYWRGPEEAEIVVRPYAVGGG